ncbi:MAG: MazG family protein [Solitalea-like symbiont of Tyrophagus putrescentiae]
MGDKTLQEFKTLIDIIQDLRKKCPWDKKQNLETLRTLTLSEVYELSQAILDNDVKAIKDELGDLLGHILFYTTIGSEENLFSLLDIILEIKNKLIRRHPHIYGDLKISTEEEVRRNWELTKMNKEGKKSIFGGLPKSLPTLLKAKVINEKYNNINACKNEQQTKDELFKNLDKFKLEYQQYTAGETTQNTIANTIGDALFSLVQLTTLHKIDIDKCLEVANTKFINNAENNAT